jgi:antitoxin ParD1/3/4
MATMNISLPDKMKEWVEAQVATGKYANVSDFVRDILREKQSYEEKLASLRLKIKEGEESGESERSLDDIWDEISAKYSHDKAL